MRVDYEYTDEEKKIIGDINEQLGYTDVTKELLDNLTTLWSHGKPLLTDDDYDALVEEYVEENGEEARPFMRVKKPDGIADTPNQTLSKVYGVIEPMRPGQKTYKDWVDNVTKYFSTSTNVCVQPKYDGASVSLDMESGRYFTRGDYDNGESMDVTELFKHVHFEYHNMVLNKRMADHIKAVRFEAIMCTEIFHEYGFDKNYVNPRAAASALIMSRHPRCEQFVNLVPLRFYMDDDTVEFPMSLLAESVCTTINQYEVISTFITEKLRDGAIVENDFYAGAHYNIDGVVVSIDGKTEIAIKILNNVKETKIKNIEWQMGKTGKITPVGILEPVRFDNGVTVDHVGLSTFERVLNLNLHFNETVRVMHNIVPYLLDGKGDGDMRIPTPTKCPICGKPLDMSNLRTVRCINPECQSKKLGDIVRYCETMKMMGLSKGILTKLYDMGYVQSIPDLYKIDYQRLALEKGFAETSCNAIRKSIEASSVNVTPDQWFGALPCLNVSQKTWKTIFDTHLRDDEGFFNVLIDEIDNDDCEGFLQTLIQPIIGVGPATWGAIAECFRNNWKDIRETIYHIRFLLEYNEEKGELICLSGTRDSSLVNALTLAGYRVTDDWSSEVNILLIPHEGYMSSKVKKALKHMVPIYTADDALLNIINHGKIK